jgi:glucosamine-6-phosphate deaminase
MEIIIQPTPEEASRIAAHIIAKLVRTKPDAVLGLATGSTPLLLYRELIRMHREEGLDFSGVTTFNLDEYIGLSADHPQSYNRFMRDHLFRHINVSHENVHIPDGMTDDVPGTCRSYEQRIREAGGIDLQVLGIGSDGHVGFNEPTSSLASRTRIKTLTEETLQDNARFFDQPEQQPHHVITMGIGTVMESGQVVLLAFGEQKAEAIAAAVEGPVSSMMPASALQFHPKTHMLLDEPAAGKLAKAGYYRWVYDNKPAWQQHL